MAKAGPLCGAMGEPNRAERRVGAYRQPHQNDELENKANKASKHDRTSSGIVEDENEHRDREGGESLGGAVAEALARLEARVEISRKDHHHRDRRHSSYHRSGQLKGARILVRSHQACCDWSSGPGQAGNEEGCQNDRCIEFAQKIAAAASLPLHFDQPWNKHRRHHSCEHHRGPGRRGQSKLVSIDRPAHSVAPGDRHFARCDDQLGQKRQDADCEGARCDPLVIGVDCGEPGEERGNHSASPRRAE